MTVVPQSTPKIYLFTAQVKHSQKLLDTPLKVWLAVKENGEVVYAHCNCMAGLGEVCSHVAAVLFTAEVNTQVKNCTSSTSFPCAWLPCTQQYNSSSPCHLHNWCSASVYTQSTLCYTHAQGYTLQNLWGKVSRGNFVIFNFFSVNF